MRNVHKLPIKYKMTLAFLSINLISVIIMASLSQFFYGQESKNDFSIITQEATTRLNHHMDFYFRQIINSTASLIVSDEVQQYISSNEPNTANEIQDISRQLKRYVALNNSEITGMFLISRNNKKLISMDGVFQSEENKYVMEPWYPLTELRTPVILPTHRVNYLDHKGTPVLSIIIPIFNSNTVEMVGRLVIELSLFEIKETFDNSKLGKKLGVFFIVSSDDTIVYHPQQEWIGAPRSGTELAPLRFDKDKETTVQQWQREDWLVAATKSTVADWKIVSIVPFEEMAGGLYAARRALLVAFILLSLVIVLIIPVLSNSYTSPLLSIRNMMGLVARGNLTARAKSHTKHFEFQQLNNSFNDMVTHINELMDAVTNLKLQEVHLRLRQKEALIKALQNQINPHLLYNSLDIIKSIAYLKKVSTIQTIALNLGDVYRYTAKFTEGEVTLQDELDNLHKYLEIISLRFPGIFQSKFYVHDKYRDCRIIKLSLQPIVENAVKYAIEPIGGDGTILVSAYDDKGDLVVEIADNGDGFPVEKLKDIRSQLFDISNYIQDRYVEQDSLGISNVHARLVLKYGEMYGISIESFPGRGSVISIRVPYSKIGS
jgi:two-component system sensor histidine kinase YesM